MMRSRIATLAMTGCVSLATGTYIGHRAVEWLLGEYSQRSEFTGRHSPLSDIAYGGCNLGRDNSLVGPPYLKDLQKSIDNIEGAFGYPPVQLSSVANYAARVTSACSLLLEINDFFLIQRELPKPSYILQVNIKDLPFTQKTYNLDDLERLRDVLQREEIGIETEYFEYSPSSDIELERMLVREACQRACEEIPGGDTNRPYICDMR